MKHIEEAKLKVTIAPTAISTRNIAPAKRVLKTGVPVGLASDNMRDFFNPLGSGDVKQVALLLSYLQRFFLQEEVEQIFHMITYGGANVLSVDYGLKIGNRGDITVLDVNSVNEVIAYQSQPVLLLRNGSLV